MALGSDARASSLVHQSLADYEFDDQVLIRVVVRMDKPLANLNISLKIRTLQGSDVVFFDTRLQHEVERRYQAGVVYCFDWEIKLPLLHGSRVRICFEASTANIGNYYLAADVFLLCSRVESYPRVVLEALAFSLPIITTPVFGVVEQIPDSADAFFYAPGDVAHLGKHMLEMANSPKARQQLSQCSRARFTEMASFDQMLQAYEGVLRDAEKYAA